GDRQDRRAVVEQRLADAGDDQRNGGHERADARRVQHQGQQRREDDAPPEPVTAGRGHRRARTIRDGCCDASASGSEEGSAVAGAGLTQRCPCARVYTTDQAVGSGKPKVRWRMNDPTAPESAVEKIDSGVWSIRVPMPRHPLRASLCYAYVAEDGTATVIDPGWPTEESWTALVDGLRAIGADPARVDQILLTHGHRDHSGLAGRLAKVSGARVRLHREDREMLVPKGAAHGERVRHWLALAGVDDTDRSEEHTS